MGTEVWFRDWEEPAGQRVGDLVFVRGSDIGWEGVVRRSKFGCLVRSYMTNKYDGY